MFKLGNRVPSQNRSRMTLDLILRATHRLLEVESFDSLNVNEVAKLAGVSVGALYHHFSSKESLISAWEEQQLTAAERWFRTYDPLSDGISREASMRAFAEEAFFLIRQTVRRFDARRWQQLARYGGKIMQLELHPHVLRVVSGADPDMAAELAPACDAFLAAMLGLALYVPADRSADSDRVERALLVRTSDLAARYLVSGSGPMSPRSLLAHAPSAAMKTAIG